MAKQYMGEKESQAPWDSQQEATKLSLRRAFGGDSGELDVICNVIWQHEQPVSFPSTCKLAWCP